MAQRIYSSYELNHLRKHGHGDTNLVDMGEKPVEYLTGHAEFCNLDFLVNEHTLIPRLESEKIVEIALTQIIKQECSHPAIADIGTGSGCLGLSLVVKLAQRQIPYTLYLSDISSDALKVARQNASRLLTSSANLFFEQSNLLENFPKIKFDFLLANLPYIPSKNIDTLPTSVKDFEPLTALDGGPTGVTLINRLLRDIPSFLSDQGLAILEIDDTHTLRDFVVPKTLSATIEKDVFQVPRFLILHSKL